MLLLFENVWWDFIRLAITHHTVMTRGGRTRTVSQLPSTTAVPRKSVAIFSCTKVSTGFANLNIGVALELVSLPHQCPTDDHRNAKMIPFCCPLVLNQVQTSAKSQRVQVLPNGTLICSLHPPVKPCQPQRNCKPGKLQLGPACCTAVLTQRRPLSFLSLFIFSIFLLTHSQGVA